MNNGTNAAVNAPRSKEELEQPTSSMTPGQIEMEEDLGLDPSVNLPAKPDERKPYANPDNLACSSREHHEHRQQ